MELDLNLDRTTVSRKNIEARADNITALLQRAKVPPDFTTALGLLGLAVLQLKHLGAVDSNVREAVEYWLAQRKDQEKPGLIQRPKPHASYIRRIMDGWLRDRKH